MRTITLLLTGACLMLLTMCESNINGPVRRPAAELQPGPFTASMDIGSYYLAKMDEMNSGSLVEVIEQFSKVPVSGDLEGVFEGSIHAELKPGTNSGTHAGAGMMKLSNGIIFEVEIAGRTSDLKDSGYLEGYDASKRYQINAQYTEENGSCRGHCNRPLVLTGWVRRIPFNDNLRVYNTN